MQKPIPASRSLKKAACSLFFVTVSVLFFSNAYAFYPQQSTPVFQHALYLPPDARPADWIYDKTVDNVECYHMITACEGKKVVLLKFNNKNSGAVKVTWKEVFKTQMEQKREGYAGKKQLLIPAGETAASGCADSKNKELLISSSQVAPTYAAEIQSFEYKEIQVTKEK